MSLDTLIKIIDFIFNSENDNKFFIYFFGGEPTLFKDHIYHVISYIERRYAIGNYIKYIITTNGSLLDDSFISFLRRNNFLVRISIDGDHNTQKLNRRAKNHKDLYNDIINNALYLNEKGVQSSIRMTVTDNNVEYLFNNVIYFHNLGFTNISIGVDYTKELTNSFYLNFQKNLIEIEKYYIYQHQLGNEFVFDQFDGQFSKFIYDFGNNFIMCGGGITSFKFYPNGDIFPCMLVCNDSSYSIGNIHTHIDYQKSCDIVGSHMCLDSPCEKCNIAFFCHYMKCGYQNFIKTGYFNVPSSDQCKVQKIIYPIAKRVYDYIKINHKHKIQPYLNYAQLHGFSIVNDSNIPT